MKSSKINISKAKSNSKKQCLPEQLFTCGKKNVANQVLQEENGDRYKMSKNEDIAPSLNKMINFLH